MRIFLLLIGLTFLQSAVAQIGKEFNVQDFKGSVEQVVTRQYYETETNAAGEIVGIGTPVTSTTTLRDGKPVQIEQSFYFGEGNKYHRTSREEIDWNGDEIEAVRFYGDVESRGNKIFKRYLPMYLNGRIVAENIIYDRDELRATVLYEYTTLADGAELLEMTMYKPDERGPQGRFYIESDEWGERLHIESVGQDTGVIMRRTAMIGDSISELYSIANSRRNRGTKDTFRTVNLFRYDTHGNPTYTLMESEKISGEPMPKQRILDVTEYYYTGDALPTPNQLTSDELRGNWVNSEHDLRLSIDGPKGGNAGIFGTSEINQLSEIEVDLPDELVADTDSWIIGLANSEIGEWTFDAESQTLNFKQKDHLVVSVRASLDLFNLRLSPVGYGSDLVLRRE